MRIVKNETVLVVIDIQEKLMPVMQDGASVTSEAAKLIMGCMEIGVPVMVTQQYTKGLGDSVGEVKEPFSIFEFYEKSTYSAMDDSDFVVALTETSKNTVIICGVETHVCVLQTALDMLERGYHVLLAIDAVSSRKPKDKEAAIQRMIQAGVVPTTVESALFELLEGDTKSDTFKAISRLVK